MTTKLSPKQRRVVVYPYNMASGSVKALCNALESDGIPTLRVYPDRNYAPKSNDFILNWGQGRAPDWSSSRMINPVKAVETAGNKLSAFNVLREHVYTPSFTSDKGVAQAWANSGDVVVVRHTLRGHSGQGIELVGANIIDGVNDGIVPDAPLYTLYTKKIREYRVHVAMGKVIDWQQKMLRTDFPKENVNYQVRNLENGWIFARESAEPPGDVITTAAIKAVQALGLHFGAVDIGYNSRARTGYVYEVNTAPGLQGSTVTSYASFIKENL